MANFEQVYSIINATQKMAWGEVVIDVVDTSSFIAFAEKSLKLGRDVFCNTLYDTISKVVCVDEKYDSPIATILMDSNEYDSIMQKISVNPIEARENPEYKVGEQNYSVDYMPILKPEINQFFVKDFATWENGVTIPDRLYKTAFDRETRFVALVDAIFTALENGMELAKERMISLTKCTYIAKVLHEGGQNAVNVYALYKEANPTTTATADNCINDSDYQRFLARLLNDYSTYMSVYNKTFNIEGLPRFTRKDRLRVEVLSTVDSRLKNYLLATTYNNSYVTLPNYRTVPFWQGEGISSFDFDDVSSIKISLGNDSDNKPIEVEQKNILAIMFDEYSMGCNIFEDESASDRINHEHITNYYRQMTGQYFCDTSEQFVVFYNAPTE